MCDDDCEGLAHGKSLERGLSRGTDVQPPFSGWDNASRLKGHHLPHQPMADDIGFRARGAGIVCQPRPLRLIQEGVVISDEAARARN